MQRGSLRSENRVDSALSTAGFWGPPTSVVDWCEANYEYSYYVAEFFNTSSSLIITGVALFGLWKHYKWAPIEVYLLYIGIALVGLGSVAFHGTLLFPMQLWDELPMMWTSLAISYDIVKARIGDVKIPVIVPPMPAAIKQWAIRKNYLFVGKGSMFGQVPLHCFLLVFFTLASLFGTVAVSEHSDQQFYAFHELFRSSIILNFASAAYACYLFHDKRMWNLFAKGIASFLLGFLLWNNDFYLCDYWTSTFKKQFGVGYPQFHALWHVFSVLGLYFASMVYVNDFYIRMYDASVRKVEIAYWMNFLPYLVIPVDAVPMSKVSVEMLAVKKEE